MCVGNTLPGETHITVTPEKMIIVLILMSAYGVLPLRARVQNHGASFASAHCMRPTAVHWQRTHNHHMGLCKTFNLTQAEA